MWSVAKSGEQWCLPGNCYECGGQCCVGFVKNVHRGGWVVLAPHPCCLAEVSVTAMCQLILTKRQLESKSMMLNGMAVVSDASRIRLQHFRILSF